jgi:sugar lactone lactonase YvrE
MRSFFKKLQFMRKMFLLFLLFIFIYLIAWPIQIHPVAWSPALAPQLKNEYAINNYLASATIISSDELVGPEDIDVDSNGQIYAGFKNGKIFRYTPEGQQIGLFAYTGGRPLGLDFDNFGNLIVADAKKGLLSINKDGIVETLATEIEGIPLNFTDDIDVAPDGLIYFTDASEKFDIHNYRADFFEHRPHGKLMRYNPLTNKIKLLLDSLYFANGVAVSNDGNFLLFTETYDFSVSKYWLKGPKIGTREIICSNMPGFPDGISTGSDGVFWIGMFTTRNAIADALAPKPFLRKIVYRLPLFLQPAPAKYGFILGIDSSGNVIYNLQDPSETSFSPITSVEEKNGFLYLGSLSYSGFASILIPE